MIITYLKNNNFNFDTFDADIKDAVNLLQTAIEENGTENSQRIEVLDRSIFDAMLFAEPENKMLQDIKTQISLKEANVNNDGFNTVIEEVPEFSEKTSKKSKILEPEPQKEKTFKERINVEKTAENFKDIRQSLDEFFTPKWTAQIMFDLAIKHGFKGGSILEPSFGHGVFFDVAIENSSKTELGIKEENLYGFEIYKPNFEVVKKNHPKAKLFDHNFEYQFIEQDIFYRKNKIEKSIDFKKKQFDLVLGNPPYGKHTSPHSFYFDNKMQIRYEGFFIWLALQKVKQGGLVVFIINSLWLQNGNLYNHQKEQIAKLGDLIDAYRLPNKTFKDTDIATDIVVFRKK
jgi:type I restriction-modification system DNA methylase subunit